MTTHIPEYFADIVQEMAAKSRAIRRDFSSHRPSAGTNREQIVADFLRAHLPRRFGVETGLVVNVDGQFSKQADLVIVDAMSNAPYHSQAPNPLWPVEAVYSLIEVKTSLTLPEINDCIAKCRQFKQLKRQFADVPGLTQNIRDSLFVIWAFESPDPMTVVSNLIKAQSGVPRNEQVDMVIIPGSSIIISGSYQELCRLGQPGSSHRLQLHQRFGPDVEALLKSPVEIAISETNALLMWFTWFDSWLRRAGMRSVDPATYVPLEMSLGDWVQIVQPGN
ncbi:MAG: hypothetical protein PHF56_23345 [Desulfuromonadaceae bacterium]|nr:hypothetical protein [Desulfuromonadaceae bacterium]